MVRCGALCCYCCCCCCWRLRGGGGAGSGGGGGGGGGPWTCCGVNFHPPPPLPSSHPPRPQTRTGGRWSSRLTGLLHALHAPVPAPAPSPPPVTYTCGQGSPPITAHHAHTHATHVCTHAPRPHGPLAPHSPSVTPPPTACEHAHATTDACGWCGRGSGGGGESEVGGEGSVRVSVSGGSKGDQAPEPAKDAGAEGTSRQQKEGEEGERGGGEGRGQGGLGRKLRRLLQKWSEGGQQQDTKSQDQDTVKQPQEPRPAPQLCSEPQTDHQTEGGAGVEAGWGGGEEGKREGDKQAGEQIREPSCSSEHPGGDPGGGVRSTTQQQQQQQHDTKPQKAPLTPPPLSWGVREVVRRARRDSGGSVVSEGGARGVRSVVNSTWSRWRRLQGSVGSLTANIRHRYHQHRQTRQDTKSDEPSWSRETPVTPTPTPTFTPKQPQVVVVEAEPEPALPPVAVVSGVAVGEGGRASPGSWSPVGDASPPSSSSDEAGDSSTGTVIFRPPKPTADHVMVTPSSDDALRQHHHQQQHQTAVCETDSSKVSAGGGGEEGRRGSRRMLRRTSDGPVWDGEPQAKRPSLASPPPSPPTSPLPPLPSRPPPTTTTSYSNPNSPISLTRKLFCETMMGGDTNDTILQPSSSPSVYAPVTPSQSQGRGSQEKGGGDIEKRGDEAEGWCGNDLGGVSGGGGVGDSSSLPSAATTTCEDSHAPAAVPVGRESFGASQALQDTSWSDEEAVSGSEGSFEGGVRRDSAEERRTSDATQVAALDTVSDVTSLISDIGADITPGGAYDNLPSTTFFVSEGEEEVSVSDVRLCVAEVQTGMSVGTEELTPIVCIIITDETDVSWDVNELEEELRREAEFEAGVRATATELVTEVCQEASDIVAEVRAEAHEIVEGVCTEASEIVAEVRAEASEIVAGVCAEATQQVAEVRAEASEIVAGVCAEASQKLTAVVAGVPSVVVSTDEDEGTVVDVITIQQQTVLDITVEVETDDSDDTSNKEVAAAAAAAGTGVNACKQLGEADVRVCKQEKTGVSACKQEQKDESVCLQEDVGVSGKNIEQQQQQGGVSTGAGVRRTSEEHSECVARTPDTDTTTRTSEQDLSASPTTGVQESSDGSRVTSGQGTDLSIRTSGEQRDTYGIDTGRGEEDSEEEEEELITPTNKEWPGAGESEAGAAMPPGSYATQREPLLAVVRQEQEQQQEERDSRESSSGVRGGDSLAGGSPSISPEADDMTPVVNDVNFSLTYIAEPPPAPAAATAGSDESHARVSGAEASGMALADTSDHHATASPAIHDADFEETCGGGRGEKELMTVSESDDVGGETSVAAAAAGVSQGREAAGGIMTTEQQQFIPHDSQQITTTVSTSHAPQSQQEQQQQHVHRESSQLSCVEEAGGVTSVAGEYDEGELQAAGGETPAVSQWEDGGTVELALRSAGDHVVPAGVSECLKHVQERVGDVTRTVPDVTRNVPDGVTANVPVDVTPGVAQVLPRTVDDLGSTGVHSETGLMQEIDDHLPAVTSQTGSAKQESNIRDQELSTTSSVIDHGTKIIELSVVKEEEGNGESDKEELEGRLKTVSGDEVDDSVRKIGESKQCHVTSGYVDDKQETNATSRTVPRERIASDGSKESAGSGGAVCGDGVADQADIESDRALVDDDDDDDEMRDVSGGERDEGGVLAGGDSDVEMVTMEDGAERRTRYDQVGGVDAGGAIPASHRRTDNIHDAKYGDDDEGSSSRQSRRRASSLKHVESHPDVEHMFVDDDQLEYEEEIMEIERTKTGPRILITIAGTEGSSSVGGVATSSVAGMGTGTTPTIMLDSASASATTSDMGGGSLEGACFSTHTHHPHHHHHHHHHHPDDDEEDPCTHATSNNVLTTGTTTTTTTSSSSLGASHLVTSQTRAPTPKSPITVDEWVAALPPNPTSVEDEGEAWGGVSGGGVEPVAEDLAEDSLNLGAEAGFMYGSGSMVTSTGATPTSETPATTATSAIVSTTQSQSGAVREEGAPKGRPSPLNQARPPETPSTPVSTASTRPLTLTDVVSLQQHGLQQGERVGVEGRRSQFAQLREKQSSFQSELSGLSFHSRSSIDSLLDARQADPVEVLLNLGFGGHSQDGVARIPERFLRPSQVPGNSIDDFLKSEEEINEMMETAEMMPGIDPQALRRASVATVSPLMSQLLENMRESRGQHQQQQQPPQPRQEEPAAPPPVKESGLKRFSQIAKRTAVKSAVMSTLVANTRPSRLSSVLNPENRRLLDLQGQKSPEVPRKRLIIGQNSFDLDRDGQLLSDPELGEDPLDEKEEEEKEIHVENDKEGDMSEGEEEVVRHHAPLQKKDSVWSMASSATSMDSNEEDLIDQRRLLQRSLHHHPPFRHHQDTPTSPSEPESPITSGGSSDTSGRRRPMMKRLISKRMSTTSGREMDERISEEELEEEGSGIGQDAICETDQSVHSCSDSGSFHNAPPPPPYPMTSQHQHLSQSCQNPIPTQSCPHPCHIAYPLSYNNNTLALPQSFPHHHHIPCSSSSRHTVPHYPCHYSATIAPHPHPHLSPQIIAPTVRCLPAQNTEAHGHQAYHLPTPHSHPPGVPLAPSDSNSLQSLSGREQSPGHRGTTGLQRQECVDESDPSCPHLHHHQPAKMLEDQQGHSGGSESTGRGVRIGHSGGTGPLCRSGSAQSDSSGFMDGEGAEGEGRAGPSTSSQSVLPTTTTATPLARPPVIHSQGVTWWCWSRDSGCSVDTVRHVPLPQTYSTNHHSNQPVEGNLGSPIACHAIHSSAKQPTSTPTPDDRLHHLRHSHSLDSCPSSQHHSNSTLSRNPAFYSSRSLDIPQSSAFHPYQLKTRHSTARHSPLCHYCSQVPSRPIFPSHDSLASPDLLATPPPFPLQSGRKVKQRRHSLPEPLLATSVLDTTTPTPTPSHHHHHQSQSARWWRTEGGELVFPPPHSSSSASTPPAPTPMLLLDPTQGRKLQRSSTAPHSSTSLQSPHPDPHVMLISLESYKQKLLRQEQLSRQLYHLASEDANCPASIQQLHVQLKSIQEIRAAILAEVTYMEQLVAGAQPDTFSQSCLSQVLAQMVQLLQQQSELCQDLETVALASRQHSSQEHTSLPFTPHHTPLSIPSSSDLTFPDHHQDRLEQEIDISSLEASALPKHEPTTSTSSGKIPLTLDFSSPLIDKTKTYRRSTSTLNSPDASSYYSLDNGSSFQHLTSLESLGPVNESRGVLSSARTEVKRGEVQKEGELASPISRVSDSSTPDITGQVAQLVRTEVLGQTEVLHRQLLRQNQDMADIKSLMHVLLNRIK